MRFNKQSRNRKIAETPCKGAMSITPGFNRGLGQQKMIVAPKGRHNDHFMERENKINHVEDWDSYLTNVDGVIGSIFVDLGLKNIAPVVDKPNVLWVSISMQNPHDTGLPRDEEINVLFEMEDEVINAITNQHNAIYVGRLTSGGVRQLYFYLGDITNYETTITQSMSKYPAYKFDFGNKDDKEWKGYFDFLYPLPIQYQVIMNSRVIRSLEQHGDSLTKERMVDHWIYFAVENDMKNYISTIEKHNFKVIDSYQDEEQIYVLNVGRVDKVDYDSVDEYVLYLWELAEEHNGKYDGWGCGVEKD